jgi:alpha-beta hydrolase superfamily lysophospholipase
MNGTRSVSARVIRGAVLALALAAAPAAPAAAQTPADDAAREIGAWLRVVDAGQYAESWQGLASVVRGMATAEQWAASVRQARAPYPGTVAGRTTETAEPLPQPPGAPAGEYARLVFATTFSGGASARETVAAIKEDGTWRPVGYFVAPGAGADYSAPADAPYTAVDVAVPTPAGHSLAGTLTLPKHAAGPVPAVVLITGSGAQDRDSHMPLIPDYRFFRQVADSLSRRGIAVLRMDDRGIGGSGGMSPSVTTEDFAADVRAGVAWLRARAEIDPARIALAGHSEGGVIAPLVAGSDERIAAVVLLAAPSWSGRRISDMQIRDALARTGPAGAALDSAVARAAAHRDSVSEGMPWMRWFLAHDPLPGARRLRVPVLILQGETDRQITVEQAEELGAAVRASGNGDVTVRVFPALNHLFLPDADGTADAERYAALPDKRVPAAVLGALADWLADRLRAR